MFSFCLLLFVLYIYIYIYIYILGVLENRRNPRTKTAFLFVAIRCGGRGGV